MVLLVLFIPLLTVTITILSIVAPASAIAEIVHAVVIHSSILFVTCSTSCSGCSSTGAQEIIKRVKVAIVESLSAVEGGRESSWTCILALLLLVVPVAKESSQSECNEQDYDDSGYSAGRGPGC